MSETCPNCHKVSKTMHAVGAWPQCQHRLEGRAFDPYAQCVWKARHSGCHKAEMADGSDIWTCG